MGRVSRDVFNTAVRHQVYLLGYGQHVAAEMVTAAEGFGPAVLAMLNSGRELKDLSASEFQALLRHARPGQEAALRKAILVLTASAHELAAHEASFSAKQLRAMVRPDVAIDEVPAKDAFAAVLAAPIPATGEFFPDFAESWVQGEADGVAALIGKGYANGWTNREVAQAVEGTAVASGLLARMEDNIAAVARVAIEHVGNSVRGATADANDDVAGGTVWTAILDGNTCEACGALDQQAFDGDSGPECPLHWGCRCIKVPAVNPEFAYLDQEGETRPSEAGPVDATLTYFSWLKQQPEAFQDSAIGPTRAELLRSGGLSSERFARLNLNRVFQRVTLDQMRKLEPLAFQRAGL